MPLIRIRFSLFCLSIYVEQPVQCPQGCTTSKLTDTKLDWVNDERNEADAAIREARIPFFRLFCIGAMNAGEAESRLQFAWLTSGNLMTFWVAVPFQQSGSVTVAEAVCA